MDDLLIRLAELPTEFPQIFRIRYRVFQLEQGVDSELEFDGKDEAAEHLLAYLGDRPVGTARIRRLNDQTAKLERLAVLQEVRKLGIGKKIVQQAVEYLTEAAVTEIVIHAQQPVQAFYQRLGFLPEGEVFEEAGIPHVKMRKLL